MASSVGLVILHKVQRLLLGYALDVGDLKRERGETGTHENWFL